MSQASRPVLISFVLFAMAVFPYWKWWTNPGQAFTYGDWGYYLPETVASFSYLPNTWSPYNLGGFDLGITFHLLNRALLKFVSGLSSPQAAINVLYLLPSTLLIVIGGFRLGYLVHKSWLSGLVFAVVMSFNTYSMIIRSGHLTLANAIGLSPLIIYFFAKSVESVRIRPLLISVLLTTLASAYEARIVYLIFGCLLVYTAVSSVLQKSFIPLKYLFYLSAAFAALNSYWLVPAFFTSQAQSAGVFQRSLFGESSMTISRAVNLMLPQWKVDGTTIGFSEETIPVYFWAIPLLAVISFIRSPKNNYLLFFSLISVVGIFFSKMSDFPFHQVYGWFYAHFPGFNVFRESSKFYFFTSLGYAGLLSAFGSAGLKSVGRQSRLIALLIILSVFLSNTYGSLQNTLGGLMVERTMPPDYQRLARYLDSQPGFFRIAYIPAVPKWAYWRYDTPPVNLAELIQTNWFELNSYTGFGAGYEPESEILNIFNHPFSRDLINSASIKYLVVPLADEANQDDLFKFYGPRHKFISFLSQAPYLKPIPDRFEDIMVYENTSYRGLLSDSLGRPLDYQKIGLNHYRFTTNDSASDTLFSQAFNPGWQVYPAGVNPLYSAPVASAQPHLSLNLFQLDSDFPREYQLVYFPQLLVPWGLFVSTLSGLFLIVVYFRKT